MKPYVTSIAFVALFVVAGSASAVRMTCEKVRACVSGGGVTTCQTFLICDDGGVYEI